MDSKLIKHKAFPKTLLLKDYLLDELSSCSSNGFKSFPRKQCCPTTGTVVRFLTLKQQNKYFIAPPPLLRNPSKSAISAFQTVIAAVKRLPFALMSSHRRNKSILKKTIFWKRKFNLNQIGRRPRKEEPFTTTTTTKDSCNFTASDVYSSSQVSFIFTHELKKVNDADVEEQQDGDVSGESSATRSSTETEQKQQFSPVSVLDCPFEDDEEVLSPFQHMEGTTKVVMEKIQRFGYLNQLEPLNLAKRFASMPDLACDQSTVSSTEEGEDNARKLAEQKALDLLHSWAIKADKLLLDLFTERIVTAKELDSFEARALLEAWVNGREAGEAFGGWEVQRNREGYMKDMERSGEWKCLDQEIGDIGLALEAVVFDALFEELLVDFSST